MLKKLFFILISLMIIFSANAQSVQGNKLPVESQDVAETYIQNHCKFTGPDLSLEDYSIKAYSVKNVTGYIDSVKEVKIEFELIYGNDDYQYEEKELLTIENTTGSYRITSAVGPCQTIIQHN